MATGNDSKKLRSSKMKSHVFEMARLSRAVVTQSKSMLVQTRAQVAPVPNLRHQGVSSIHQGIGAATIVRTKAANDNENLPVAERAQASTPQQVVPVQSAKRLAFQQCFRAAVWLQALHTLVIFLLNTLACVAFAWLFNFVLTLGNIFSGRSAANQSDFEFEAGTALVALSGFYVVNLVVHTHVLLRLQFVQLVGTRSPCASFAFCFRRLFARSKYSFVVATMLHSIGLVLWESLARVPRRWRLEYYLCSFSGQIFCSGITVAVRNIFRQETVQGRSRYPDRVPISTMEYLRVFTQAFVVTSPRLWITILAGMYIQATSRYQVIGSWNFVIYTVGSHFLKIATREVAKCGTARLKIKDPRSIFFAVGLPTVIIDTQVRVMLQRGQNAGFTVMWTLGMAAFEILSRLVTVLITKKRLRLKELALRRNMQQRGLREEDYTGRPTQAGTDNSRVRPADATTYTAPSDGTDTLEQFQKWKQQILVFHIAEAYASMSAEYIAIGCSSSILFFYWDHPKYELGKSGGDRCGDASHILCGSESERDTGDITASSSLWSRGYAICVQIGVEIVVDYLSCVLEITEGIDFQPIQKYRGYLGVLFVGIAALNIQICALIYFNGSL